MLLRLLALALLGWPAPLGLAAGQGDDLDSLLKSTIGDVVAEQEALLHYTQEDEGTQEVSPPTGASRGGAAA